MTTLPTQARTRVGAGKALPLTAAAVHTAVLVGTLHRMRAAMGDKAMAPWVVSADRGRVDLVDLVDKADPVDPVDLVDLVDKVALPGRMRA